MRLGKVVKSNSHCDYVVQLADGMDVAVPPRPEDYGFGCFVKLEGTPDRVPWPLASDPDSPQIALPWQTPSVPTPTTVGIIYNSQLFNPQFLNNGPRLSSDPDPLFTPDLINETRTLLGVVLIGELRSGSPQPHGIQGIPPQVVPVNTQVYRMTLEEIRAFHRSPQGKPQFRYYSLLLRYGGSFATHLTEQVLQELVGLRLFQDADQRALETLCREMSWKNTLGAMA